MYRLLSAVLGVGLIAVFALGCGGSGDDEETAAGSPAISKAQFIKQADEACAEITRKREAAAAAWRKRQPGTYADDRIDDGFREVIVPSIEEQVKALEALSAPAEEEATVHRIIQNLAKVGTAIKTEGAEGTKNPAFFAYQQEASGYGMRICPRLV